MAGLLSLALVLIGLGLFAAAMPQHWRQLRGAMPLPGTLAFAMRLGGSVLLACALTICVLNNHPTIGTLVWIMQLALGAALVAMYLAYRSKGDPDTGGQ